MSQATDKNNQILKEVINNSWSGIGIVDFSSRFIFVNEAFKPILGYSKEELLEMSFHDIIMPKYQKEFLELLKTHRENQYINNMLVGCIRKDKQLVYLDLSLKQMSNQKFIVINVNDVTKNISDHEIFDRYVIQLHVDTKGIITQVSEAFCKLTLFEEDELVGQSYQFLIDEKNNRKNTQEEAFEEFSLNGQFTGIVAIKDKQSECLWVDVIIKAIKNKYGDTTGYSAVMFDITNQIKLQQNTEILEETIVDNLDKLQIMSQTMRTVAHEWRQPLNSISLNAQNLLISYELMGDTVSKEEAIPILQGMQDKIQELSDVISQFQYITEFHGNFVNVALETIIKRGMDLSIVDNSLVQVNLVPININTCVEPLIQTLSFVFNNAQEALQRAQIENPFIKVEVQELSNKCIVSISNNGGHIPSDIIENIFNPYFSTKTEKNGVGLSLYVAKMIIEFHLKGKIEAQNIDDDIVEFKIRLPKEEI